MSGVLQQIKDYRLYNLVSKTQPLNRLYFANKTCKYIIIRSIMGLDEVNFRTGSIPNRKEKRSTTTHIIAIHLTFKYNCQKHILQQNSWNSEMHQKKGIIREAIFHIRSYGRHCKLTFSSEQMIRENNVLMWVSQQITLNVC